MLRPQRYDKKIASGGRKRGDVGYNIVRAAGGVAFF